MPILTMVAGLQIAPLVDLLLDARVGWPHCSHKGYYTPIWSKRLVGAIALKEIVILLDVWIIVGLGFYLWS